MVDPDTFLTYLYVIVDEFCKGCLPPAAPTGGRAGALDRSEVITLAVFGQWGGFGSERGFYRYAARRLRGAFPRLPHRSQFNRRLRGAFPRLPHRSQFNRQQREHQAAIAAFGHHLADRLGRAAAPYEALDCAGVPTRNAKRGGAGWLAGLANIGRSSRLGWFEGAQLLTAVLPGGALSGYALAPASTKEQRLAEDFLAARRHPDPRCPGAGRPSGGPYVADNGFVGAERHRRWREAYGARVLCPPQRSSPRAWPPDLLRWHAGLRQIVETVYDKLHHTFRLDRERPHALGGLLARLAAKVALHNFCMWLNRHLGRPLLAFADLVAW
jgi:hypothetical protein